MRARLCLRFSSHKHIGGVNWGSCIAANCLSAYLHAHKHTHTTHTHKQTCMLPVCSQVGFSWSFTRETLLACELTELERLLASRQEVLAMLHPLSSARVARMMSPAGPGGQQAVLFGNWADSSSNDNNWSELRQQQQQAKAAAAAAAGSGGAESPTASQLQQQEHGSSDSDDGLDSDTDSSMLLTASQADLSPGNSTGQPHARRSRADGSGGGIRGIIKCPDVFAGLNLGLADSTVVALEVGVVEVAHLAPRSGWSQDLTHSLLSSAAAGNARGADSSSASATVLMETAKREDLPLPVVYVFCGAGGPGDKGFEVG